MRSFYEGTCDTVNVLPSDTKVEQDPAKFNKLCNKVTLQDIILSWPFDSNLIFLINDNRFQLPLMSHQYNIEPITINMVIKDSKIKTVNPKLKYTGDVYQNLTWKIYPEKYWKMESIFNENPGANLHGYESMTAMINLFAFVLSVLCLLIFMIRKWRGLMYKEVKYC